MKADILIIYGNFKEFEDISEYSNIVTSRLEPAHAYINIHAPSTQCNFSVALTLAGVINRSQTKAQ
jgi:hypothetical protein